MRPRLLAATARYASPRRCGPAGRSMRRPVSGHAEDVHVPGAHLHDEQRGSRVTAVISDRHAARLELRRTSEPSADSSYVMSCWTSRRSWYLLPRSVFVSTARLRAAGSCPVMPVLPAHGGSPSRGRARRGASVARPVGSGRRIHRPCRSFSEAWRAPQFEGSRPTLRTDGRMDSCSCSGSTRPVPPATAHACATPAEYSDRGGRPQRMLRQVPPAGLPASSLPIARIRLGRRRVRRPARPRRPGHRAR